ncbi:hypothetical protein PCE1_004982 [Barthelona sp. PCE]
MPRLNPHISSSTGVVHQTHPNFVLFEPHGYVPPSRDTTFLIAPDTKNRIKLPKSSYLVRTCTFSNMIHDSPPRREESRISLYKLDNGIFQEVKQLNIERYCDIHYSTVTILNDRFTIFFARHCFVVDFLTGSVVRNDYDIIKRSDLIFTNGTDYLTPIIINDLVEFITIQVPYTSTMKIVKIINADILTVMFISSECIYLVTIMDGIAHVEQEFVHFEFESDPSEAFIIDDVYYFFMPNLHRIVGYKYEGQFAYRHVEVSHTMFNNVICLNGILYLVFYDYMFPFEIHNNFRGYGVLKDMPFKVKHFRFISKITPVMVSDQHVLFLDIFRSSPCCFIHGASEGNDRVLVISNSLFKHNEIVYTHLYHDGSKYEAYEDKEFCQQLEEEMPEYLEACYTSKNFVRLKDGHYPIMQVGSDEIEGVIRSNNWFETMPVNDVMWCAGSSEVGLVIFNDNGKLSRFRSFETVEDMYTDVAPNQYNPMMAVIPKDEHIDLVVYDEVEDKFSHLFVREGYAKTGAFTFIDTDVFLYIDMLYRVNSDGVERIDLKLPWDMKYTYYVTYLSVERGTITRLSTWLDGYDITFDVLSFNHDYSSYVVEQKRVNVLELILQQCEFFPVSSIGIKNKIY